MEALSGPPRIPPPPPKFEPNSDKITRRLLKHGVDPTPKIIHTLRKKEFQKQNRRQNRLAAKNPSPPLSAAQTRALAEESAFQTMKLEYKALNRALSAGEGAGREELDDLREMFEVRRRDELRWVLDDDVEVEKEWLDNGDGEIRRESPRRRERNESEVVRFLVERISGTRMVRGDWKLPRMMKQSGLEFTEAHLLRIVGELGSKKDCWERALSVVEWAYSDKDKKRNKSRFVYTKLLSVLGKAMRFKEALKVFETMLGDYHIYPDMAAYHSIAVTLGQAGRLRDLIKVMECMRETPSKKVKHLHNKNWNPTVEPDIVIYNAVLNACVSSRQWKGVSWVFKQIRASGLKPNGATYGLSMEVMLESGKYELVYEYFQKMVRSSETPKALTYKVLVKAYSSEGKVKEAFEAVHEMEQRGVVGAGSVYYAFACCLCSNGMWKEAMLEVEKMSRLSDSRPLEVTFTGMITASMHAGHIENCISIFDHMKIHCSPNVGTVNIMLKVYGHNDMFSKAKALFEETKRTKINSSEDLNGVARDEFTYGSMLEASAMALQWEYFECVYKEMVLSGYQLDQTRHSWLLLQASKAGKSHLLEHAFNAILQAGEIPNPNYFTEMLLQATAREDYDKCVTLIDTMSLAPFQFTEEEWKQIFEKNTNRIFRAHLENLSDSLKKCEVKSEATVVNLSKTLQRSLELSNSEGEISAAPEKTMVVKKCSEEEEEIIGDDESDSDEELAHSLDVSLREISLAHGHTDFDELFFEGVDAESDKSDLPSAVEVLEGWKESGKKDGKLFSSGFGLGF